MAYTLKLKALLHDPVHKMSCMDSHEKVACDLLALLSKANVKDECIKEADRIAAGVSRIVVSPQINNQPFKTESAVLDDKKYIDPFTVKECGIGTPKSHAEVENVFKALGKVKVDNEEDRARFLFLFLWRFLPEIFPWISTHPADSRAPNHSTYDHAVQTSAIASCLAHGDKPAFLLFTIAPVQKFIAAAKKTQDLWGGSYLLSYVIFEAIKVIMEGVGVDNIVFPSLRDQPLVDRWLYEQFKDKDVDIATFQKWKKKWSEWTSGRSDTLLEGELTIANISNRFLAIVPASTAKDLGKQCQERVFAVLQEFGRKCFPEKGEVIQEQLRALFHVYWVVVPWALENDANPLATVMANYETFVEKPEEKSSSFEKVAFIANHPYYKSQNLGAAYSLLVDMTERFLAARKNIRDFVNIKPQKDKKCQICGEYSVVKKDDETDLCGVCLLKRKMPGIIKDTLSLKQSVSYPSTADVATATWRKQRGKEKDKPVYYAILAMDGDEMGLWLKGEKMPTIRDLLHPDVVGALEKHWDSKEKPHLERFLGQKHPMTHSFHNMFSERLSIFALKRVKQIVEEDHSGTLIYAGGDDVLAFLPVSDVLGCASDLQSAFGEVFTSRASMSAGIVLVHHKYPLQMALNEVRDAEQRAKKQYGRNACCLKLIRHSGEMRTVGFQWDDRKKAESGKNLPRKDFLDDIVALYSEDRLSSKFGYDYMAVVRSLIPPHESMEQDEVQDGVKEILLMELERMYKHKTPSEKRDPRFMKKMLDVFCEWPYGYGEFSNMFIVGRFLSHNGKEA